MLLEEEQATTTDLERKATATKGLLPSSSFSTMSDMVDGVAYNSTLVTNLHIQATTVPNVHQLVNIMLDTTSSNYAIWHEQMLMALTRYVSSTTSCPMMLSSIIMRGLGWTLSSSVGSPTRSLPIFKRSFKSVAVPCATCGLP
jgi:hypothetical protein